MSADARARTYAIAAGMGLADVWWRSSRMTVKAGGAQTDGSLAQIETDDPLGAATPLHLHHNEDETFYVLEGEVSLLVDGRRIDLAVGDYAFAPRETTHAYIVLSQRARMLTTLTPAGLEEVFVALGVPVAGNDRPPEHDGVPIHEVIRRFGAYGCEVVGPPPTLAEMQSAAR